MWLRALTNTTDGPDGPHLWNLETVPLIEWVREQITLHYNSISRELIYDGSGGVSSLAAMRNLARLLGAYDFNADAVTGARRVARISIREVQSATYDWFLYRWFPLRHSVLLNLRLLRTIERTRNTTFNTLFNIVSRPPGMDLTRGETADRTVEIFTKFLEITDAIKASALAL